MRDEEPQLGGKASPALVAPLESRIATREDVEEASA
jgi:hypothetical protein